MDTTPGAPAGGADRPSARAPERTPEPAPDRPDVLRIDCDDCSHQGTDTCADCLVTFLCEREEDGAVIIPLDEVRAVRMLQGAGLAPRVRHRRRVG